MWLRGPAAGGSAVQTMLQIKNVCLYAMLVCLALLLLDAPFTSARPRHPSKHHSRGHNHKHKHKGFKIPTLSAGSGLPIQISYHLVISQTKPTQPPWELSQDGKNQATGNSAGSTSHSSSHQHRRAKRSAVPLVSVCEDIGEWVALNHTKDIYDYDVDVLQGISVGGVRMDQYFYETRCIQEQVPCAGVDSLRFESACQNKYIWTYGYVKNNRSEEGWRQIRIKGSCNCGIRAKPVSPSVSLLELI